jgi:hypothetical protein
MKQQAFFIDTQLNEKGSKVLSTDFGIGTLIINNTTNARFKIYYGEVSIGIGSNRFDYLIDGFTFAQLPMPPKPMKVTIEWEATTQEFEYIRIDLLEEIKEVFFQTNAPLTGGVGLAQNVSVAAAIPTGANTIGKVNIGTMDLDVSRNGTSIAGESLSSGGSNTIGWLSEIAKRIKTVLQVTVTGALPVGTNVIGKVDINTLPNISINAGTNNIGDVDVLTLPSIPVGSNTIGKVDINDATKNIHHNGELLVGTTILTYDMTGSEITCLNYIINDGSVDVFLSFDNTVVTTTPTTAQNGIIRLKAGQGISDFNRKISKINCISTVANNTVRVLGV